MSLIPEEGENGAYETQVIPVNINYVVSFYIHTLNNKDAGERRSFTHPYQIVFRMANDMEDIIWRWAHTDDYGNLDKDGNETCGGKQIRDGIYKKLLKIWIDPLGDYSNE